MVITAVGQVYVWDIRKGTAKHPPVSLAPVLDAAKQSMDIGGAVHLTQAPSLMFARMNSQGRVVVGMSNGEGFAYNSDMYVWQRLSEAWWAVGSQYWNTTDTSLSNPSASTSKRAAQTNGQSSFLDDIAPENVSAGIIPLLERNTTSQALLKGRAFFLQRLVKMLLSAEGYEGFETSVSIAHLETRVAAAHSLEAKDEFRTYLVMYAKRLGAEGASCRGKVEELLTGLSGDIFTRDEDDEDDESNEEGVYWGSRDQIVGWKRELLLKEVVMMLGRQRDLQRTTVPYARALGVLEDLDGNGNAMITDG